MHLILAMASLRIVAFLSLAISLTIQIDYPKNKNITKGKTYDSPRSLVIESKSVFDSHIANSEYAITIFHMDWCGHCKHFIPIFDKASTFQITKKFNFFKVNCNHKEICNAYNVDRFPTIKVFHKGSELKAEPVHELEPFLEFIDKLTSNPIVKVTDVSKFYADYSASSPLIKYNENKPEFLSCITSLAKGDYLTSFYFGVMPISDSKEKERLIFDFDNNRLSYEWKGNCDEMRRHLNNNMFPLMKKVDSGDIKKIQRSSKVTILLFINDNDDKHMRFIEKQYTTISKFNRNIVFGYVDMNTDKELATQLKIDYKNSTQLIVYDFSEYKYYIEPREIDMDKEEKCYQMISLIAMNVKTLKYTTGSKLDDFLMEFGLRSNSTTFAFVLLGALLALILLMIGLIICCDKSKDDTPSEAYKQKQQ